MRKYKLKYQTGGYTWNNPDSVIPDNIYNQPLYRMDPNTGQPIVIPTEEVPEIAPNRSGIDAFMHSPFGMSTQNQYQRRGYDMNIDYDNNSVQYSKGTGQMLDNPYVKDFNLLATGVTGVANWMSNNRLKNQEEQQVSASLQPRYWQNMERYGLNNIPAYTQYGGVGSEEPWMIEGIAHPGVFYGDTSVYNSYSLRPGMRQNGGPSPEKAAEILHDGTIRGKPITDRQRKYFGAIMSAAQKAKKQTGGTVASGPVAPKGYKPLTQQQRQDWNGFVQYLNRDVKIGGSQELDNRSNALGLNYLNEYAKAHPGFSITPNMVPYVQYEFQSLNSNKTLPDINLSGRVKQVVEQQFPQGRVVSDADGWIGSLTSRQGYPIIVPFDEDKDKRFWNLDYQGANDYGLQLDAAREQRKQQMLNSRPAVPSANQTIFQTGGHPIEPLDPAKKGTFKALASRKGMSMDALAADIKSNPDKYSTEAKRKAAFYRNIVKQAGGDIPETYGLPDGLQGLANVEAEEGEVYEDRDGNYNKIADDAGRHEQGGVKLANVNRVLEDTSDKRKDKNSKLLKMSPADIEAMFGFKPKRPMSHAAAFEYVNEQYDKDRKRYTDAMSSLSDRKNLDKYMQNSATLDAQNIQTVPDPSEVFDALYMHQEAIKEAGGIADDGGNKAKKGGKYKYQTGGEVPFNPYSGGATPRGRTTPAGNSNAFAFQGGLPALIQKWQQAGFDMTGVNTPSQFQERTYDQLLSTPEGRDVLRDMWNQGNTAKGIKQNLLTDRYPTGNFKGSDLTDADLSTLRAAYADNLLGVRTITPSVVRTDIPGTPPQSPPVMVPTPPNPGVVIPPRRPDQPHSRFYEPTYWDELAPGALSLADSMNREPELYNPAEFHQLRYKLQDPSAAMAANQADYNAAAETIGNTPVGTGVALSNLSNLTAQKYKANNQIMGQYDNQNANIKNQEILYNTQVRDKQSLADAQSRGEYYRNVLLSRDNQRLQRLKAIEDLGRVAQLKRRQNRSGNLILQTTPAFDQYGEYNGYQYIPYLNPALGVTPLSLPTATKGTKGTTTTETTYTNGNGVSRKVVKKG